MKQTTRLMCVTGLGAGHFLLAATAASALNFSATIHAEAQKDRKQYCYTDFTIDLAGNYTATTLFSNGKKIDGDHFEARLVLQDKAGNVVATVRHRAGMRAAGSGSAYERHLLSTGKLDPATLGVLSEHPKSYSCGGPNTMPDELLSKILIDRFLP